MGVGMLGVFQLRLPLFRTLLLCIAGALIAIPAVSAIAAPGDSNPPAVTFADSTSLALAAKPEPVLIVNNSDTTWAITLTAGVYPDDPGSQRVPIAVTPTTISVPPAGSAQVTIGPAPNASISGSGLLDAVAKSGNQTIVFHRPISAGPATVKPAVKKWSATRVGWFSTGQLAVGSLPNLPLLAPTCDGVQSGTAYLTSDSRVAPLKYECVKQGGTAEIRFNGDDVRHAGQYSGTLSIGGTDVDISLRRTTVWLWPLLVILVGFILASAQQAWTSNYRPLRRANNRLTAIGKEALDKQQLFIENAGNENYGKYNFQTGVLQQINKLQRTLDALQPAWARRWFLAFVPWAKDEHQDEYDKVITDMTALEQVVTDWPALSDALDILGSSLAATKADGSFAMAPLLVDRAGAILNPVAQDAAGAPSSAEIDLDFKAAQALVKEVGETSVALALLPTAKQLGEQLEEVEPGDGSVPSDEAVYEEAMRKFRQARSELAIAESAEAVQKAKVDTLLTDARALVLQLDKPVTAEVDLAAVVEIQDDAAAQLTPTSGLFGLFPRLAGALKRGAGSVRSVDSVWLFVSLAVAAWTGLAALYVGKPWGQWQDYVALLVWAFGGTAVLTSLLSGLANVAAGPLVLKKTDDDAKPATAA
ncbi:hypothetical protein ACSMXN_02400 [Jatrophihabitans sp. DSM 45814]